MKPRRWTPADNPQRSDQRPHSLERVVVGLAARRPQPRITEPTAANDLPCLQIGLDAFGTFDATDLA
jgi:hypothetical protein